MANRVQLNDEMMDQVNGGAFNFYAKDGKNQCYVDGVGTFYCSDSASAWIINQVSMGNTAPAAVVAEAVEKGLFWK